MALRFDHILGVIYLFLLQLFLAFSDLFLLSAASDVTGANLVTHEKVSLTFLHHHSKVKQNSEYFLHVVGGGGSGVFLLVCGW